MSNLGTVKQICRLQNIKLHIEAIVICPYCESEKARIDINKDTWNCSCGKSGKLDELYRIIESDYLLNNHKASYWDVVNNKGVCK
ncbi:hypothetical protein [Orenia marismortui]|uniref:Uncharacterized protein n=1 Tax=Orenia marismortui TaxID=46469 RepID=A0A4R8GYT7_9FIRM|nr:hypothetical protein [Orenia marismortui]TDX49117.1 hypothetical protein C7959_12011 [Orenia marismortui]